MELLFTPPTDEVLLPYWDAIDDGRLALPRCSSCGRFQWYPDAAGPDCVGANYEWVDVTTTGTVYTLTQVHRALLPDAVDSVPFTVALIELDGVEGVRLVANVVDDVGIEIGDRVAARFVETAHGRRPIFIPADPNSDGGTPTEGR